MNSPIFLQFELGRAQAQLAESLAKPAALSPIGAESASCSAFAPERRHHLMERSFADAAHRHGFEGARWSSRVAILDVLPDE
jgi:hypothetical protein